ncbi:MAG: ribosome maturation factor RimP [Oscillospiraceae bacterium]|jgi:ribosome maturation factor RimP|nr:ribosome maturation factor RimP [Oscillospiraceae bacterium]
MSKIIDTVSALAAPIAEANGCRLWDAEYVKEGAVWYLRVYLDRAEGVTLEHGEAVSRALDPLLDEREELIPGSYTFEVSSAGAERPLKRPSDFEEFMGRLVEVRLYQSKNGRKEYIGKLKSYKDGDVAIDVAGTVTRFTKSEVANVRLRIS